MMKCSTDPTAVCNNASYPISSILSSTHGLQHSFIQTQLQTGLVKHLPFIRVPGDQAVNLHSFTLTDPVASSLGLREEYRD